MPSEFDGHSCRNGRFDEAHDKWGLSDEEVFTRDGWFACSRDGAPASAADMAVKARPPAPVIAPIYDWTGFYIGGNGGWGQSNSCLNFDDALVY